MADYTLPTRGQKPWDGILNAAINAINDEVEAATLALTAGGDDGYVTFGDLVSIPLNRFAAAADAVNMGGHYIFNLQTMPDSSETGDDLAASLGFVRNYHIKDAQFPDRFRQVLGDAEFNGDMNNLLTGWAAIRNTSTNSPVADTFFIAQTMIYNTSYGWQIAYSIAPQIKYERHLFDGVWQAWNRVYTTPGDFAALPLNSFAPPTNDIDVNGHIVRNMYTFGDNTGDPDMAATLQYVNNHAISNAQLPPRIQARVPNIDGTDLNDLLDSGQYVGSGMTNAPSASWYFITSQVEIGGSYRKQTAREMFNDQILTRWNNAGTWSAWSRVYGTLTDLGVLPANAIPKAAVTGIDQLTNTSDANKPVSTAQAAAIATAVSNAATAAAAATAPYCKLYRSAAINTSSASGVEGVLPWDAEIADALGWHSTSTNLERIIPTKAGRIQVQGVVGCSNATLEFVLRVRVNGTSVAVFTYPPRTSGNAYVQFNETVTVNGTTDYIDVTVAIGAASQPINTGSLNTRIAATFVGPA